ncbi:fibronectin type III domain-containing protein [Pedobacter duraquae]|uniref:WD domain G-beta repeat uncharacterized protein n=1 Tax=Pedobacter duraquae TaxID=425511 RepID=A0A4R6IIT1_9SPHI|nr:fibronectin type III domain-containing protein [Pedobacter duraquae]TDO21873.1 WD domain G-beta repeat uncharacterized protein [Pedobacter duraquae]
MFSTKITLVKCICAVILILNCYACQKDNEIPAEEPRFFSPSNLKAIVFTDSIIRVSWKDNSNVETSFQIQRKFGTEAFKLIKETRPNDTTFLDSAVAPNMLYTYRVRAIGKVAETSFSDEVSVKLDLPIPSLTATVVDDTEVRLTWTDNSSLESGFVLERSTNGQPFITIAEPSKNIQSYSDKTTAINTNYSYRIRARSKSTITDYSNVVAAKINFQAPLLNFALNDGTTLNLSWVDNSQFESGYVIEQSVNGGEFKELDRVNPQTTSYIVENLQTTKKYAFKIKAYSAKNYSPYSNTKQTFYNDKRYVSSESYMGENAADGQVALSPSGNLIATTSYFSENVIISNRSNRTTNRLVTGHKEGGYSVKFSSDNAFLLVSGAKEGNIEIYNTSTLTLNKSIPTGMSAIYSLNFNKTGTLLAVGGTGGSKILVYSFPSMTVKYTLTTDNHNVRDLLFYDNDSKLISSGNDNKIQIWNLNASTVETTLTGHNGHIGSVDLNSNSSILVSGSYESEDKTIRLWNPIGGLIRTIPNTASITSVFIGAEDIIYFTDADGYLRIVDKFGTKLFETAVGNMIHFADFDKTNKILVTYSANGKTNVFQNTPIWMEY